MPPVGNQRTCRVQGADGIRWVRSSGSGRSAPKPRGDSSHDGRNDPNAAFNKRATKRRPPLLASALPQHGPL
eukprot:scaffold304091_cov33-Tisochrysis_lutea.AAC.6